MKNVRVLGVALALAIAAWASTAAAATYSVDSGTYASIAYSPSTGKYGYGYNYYSRGAAERTALASCEAPDARAVAWVNWGFCALATSEDGSCWGIGYSYGEGAIAQDAVSDALADCQGRTTQAVGIAVVVLSDGQLVYRGK